MIFFQLEVYLHKWSMLVHEKALKNQWYCIYRVILWLLLVAVSFIKFYGCATSFVLFFSCRWVMQGSPFLLTDLVGWLRRQQCPLLQQWVLICIAFISPLFWHVWYMINLLSTISVAGCTTFPESNCCRSESHVCRRKWQTGKINKFTALLVSSFSRFQLLSMEEGKSD